MALYWKLFKQRFLRRYVLIALLAGVLLLGVGSFIHNYDNILYYFRVLSPESGILLRAEEAPFLAPEVVARYREHTMRLEQSMAFNFDMTLSGATMVYRYISLLLLALPALFFYNERKSGQLRLAALRGGRYDAYVLTEGLVCATASWLIALLPWLIFWGLAALLCPTVSDLYQAIYANPNTVLSPLYHGNMVIVAYLLQLLIFSPTYFFLGLLIYACSLVVNRGVYLIFIALLYCDILYILAGFLSIEEYAPSSLFMPPEAVTNLGPMLVSWLFTFLLTILLYRMFAGRERVLNG